MNPTLPLVVPAGFASQAIRIKRLQFTAAQYAAIVLATPYTVIDRAPGQIPIVTAIVLRIERDGIAWSNDSNLVVKYENEGAGTPILNHGTFGLVAVNAAGFSRLERPLLPAISYNRVPATTIVGQSVVMYQNIVGVPGASVTTFTFKFSYYIL